MKVRIKKLHPDAVVPKYATKSASGFDLVAIEDQTIYPGCTNLVKTGLAVSIPEGYELQIRPRSGLSLKTNLRVANSPGTVDADYRGEVCVIMHNAAVYQGIDYMQKCEHIKRGERIAQGVICPVQQVDFEEVQELDETNRGSGGFGSTGTN